MMPLAIRYKTLYDGLVPNDLIDQLNTYRLENRLTQEQLAKKLDVTFQTVNRWLNRRMKPRAIQEHQIKKLISGRPKKRSAQP